ncbi:MAG: GxxExxY protein [Bacteroidales bacterium]|nr:GxxExxY protein [Bacteroidales bacterium]
MEDIEKYGDIVYQIIGAAMSVHNELGGGLLEPIYSEALHWELIDRGIDNETEKTLECFYKGRKLDKYYRMDMVVGDIVVELKATAEIIPEHRFQLFNYLRLTEKPIGLLLNFGLNNLSGERYCFDKETNGCFLLDRYMKPID